MDKAKFHDWAQFIVSMTLMIGCFGFLWMVFFSGIQVDEKHKESLLQTTGNVLNIVGMVAAFWIGTSLSSKLKDKP